MTYQFEPYDRQKLQAAYQAKVPYAFTLGTGDVLDLGVTNEDDQAQVRDGGRFDLTPWRKSGARSILPPPPPVTAREILADASNIVGHLYLSLDPGAGPHGSGEISAMYSPLTSTTPRLVVVEPSV